MISWIKTYAAHHLFYIILIAVGVVSFRVWLQEHDAKVAAQVVVADLQKQIATTQAQAAQKVEVIKQVVQKAKTPQDVVQVLPTLTALPINAQPVPEDHNKLLVDALPLLQLAGQAKEEEIQLAACQQVNDLKDKQIVELKKKPRFITRIKNVAEAVGVGFALAMLVK